MKSIRSKIILLLLCFVILSCTIIGAVCIQQTYSILHSSAQENMMLLCEKNARAINTTLGTIESSVDTLAHYIVENLTSTDILQDTTDPQFESFFARINQVGTNHAAALKEIVAVYTVFDPAQYAVSGFYYQADAEGMLVSQPIPPLPQAVDNQEDWWNTPIANGSSVWIYDTDAQNNPIFSYIVPIYFEGHLLGIVGMDFSDALLHDMVSSIRLKQSGFAVVVDKHGTVVAHPDLTESGLTTQKNEARDAIAAQLAQSRKAAFAGEEYNLDAALSTALLPYEHSGVDRMLTFCTLQNGMTLFLSAPESEIFAEQTTMITIIVIAVVLISVLATVAAIIFAKRLSDPIVELNRAARHFTEGDLDTAVIPATRDEIGQLAASFEKTRVRMKSYIDELYREAHIDGLTGTQNKSAFVDEEQSINARIAADDISFCAAMFDVNYLKNANDTFGHMAGDELLQKIAACLKNEFGPQNVFRIGGDEFVAIIYTDSIIEGTERTMKCLEAIDQTQLDNYPDIPVSCSMGLAIFSPDTDKTLADVLSRADRMMYKNKAEFKKHSPFWKKDLEGMRRVHIKRYLEFLDLLSKTMDAYLFLLDIRENENWFFNDINRRFAICADGSPTNTLEEMLAIVHPVDREEIAEELAKIADGTVTEHNMNYRWIDRDGKTVWVNCHGRVINDSEGRPFLMIGRVSDTSLLPWYNPLTGLFNKAKMALDFRSQTVIPFQRFLLINIDKFSHVNIKHGRAHGDEMLRLLANTLIEKFPNRRLYHLEKDHFALLLDTQDEDVIREHIREIRKAVQDHLDISVAVVPNEKQYFADADGIYEYARILLKSKKSSAGSATVFFTKEDFAQALFGIELIEEFEKSIYDNNCEGFSLCYQPQIDAHTHEVVAAEALLRYRSPEKGQIYPDVFIPLLERTHMIRRIGEWVLDTAIAQCAKWREHRPAMGVAVNISSVQLKDESLAETVLKLLKAHNLPASSLTLELTESVELEEAAHIINFNKLRQAGVHISIDDFGTGYANLSYLKKIHANELKIDRIFIKELKQGSFHHTLISNVAAFAKNNGIAICMEGVETTEELAILELCEPDLLQGYLFDKPIPAEEFEARYITPEAPVVWGFETALKKERENVRFAYFDAKEILSNVLIGLWMLRATPDGKTGKIYANPTMREVVGLEDSLTPAEIYDFFISHLPEEELPRVEEMLKAMREDTRIVQLEFDWNHPVRGRARMRCTGKCAGVKDGVVMYEGFMRIIEDQRILQGD